MLPKNDNWFSPFVREPNPPSLTLPFSVAQKLQMYVEAVPGEVSGLGTIHKEGNRLTVLELILIQQKVTRSFTELSREAVATLLYEWMREKKDPSVIKLWWHSHFDMPTFWSATDNGTIDRFDAPWMVSLVVNRKQERLARLDLYKPFRVTIPLPITLAANENPDLEEAVSQEVQDKVSMQFPLPYDQLYDGFGDLLPLWRQHDRYR